MASLVALLSACSSGGEKDAGIQDAAPVMDATTPIDARPSDAVEPDGPAMDAQALDAEAMDTLAADTAPGDGSITCPDGGSSGFCTGIRIALLGLPGLNPSSNFQGWLRSNGQAVTRLQTTTMTSSTSSVTAALLTDYDVVILDRLVRTYSSTEARVLRDWVMAGGGVMSMSGYTGGGEDVTRPNTLLAAIGLQYLPGLQNGPVTSFAAHPVTMGLSSVTFSGGYLVGEVAGVSGGMNTVTATLSAGPVEIVQVRSNGRVVVWGDEWVEFDSEWQAMPMIQQFWVNVLGWLVHRR
jgi:hypothetical protein